MISITMIIELVKVTGSEQVRAAFCIKSTDSKPTNNHADNSTKKLLLDLVRNHIGEREGGADEQELEVDDIIPEKGKGLVVLLYGDYTLSFTRVC